MADSPLDLLRNLRQLVELEIGFGCDEVPVTKPAPGRSTRVAEEGDPPPATARPLPGAEPPGPAPAIPPAGSRRGPTASRQEAQVSREPARQTLEVWPEPDFGGKAAERLEAVAAEIRTCTRCPLHRTRTNAVPGEGDPQAEIMFVGEGPGADEDAQGRPFVGAAGQLLDRMIAAMGLKREEVFIANILKCRPQGNRTPTTEEACTCGPWLCEQIAAISPRVICTLGAPAMKALRGDDRLGIIKHRGRPFTYRDITVIPTFHPSYLLRNESAKKPAWEDLKLVLRTVGREPPSRR